ncbi:chemotaxis protein CheW [Treponema sp. OttesenSCG-928-L16]|nr:chemotaxis protein CheW [Treponema sp. OttesenSCG-928-L16]
MAFNDMLALNAEISEQKERVETVDYKMVTFSLAGKDYGVDIMNVKEIAKADKFTYVPNAASYVRGVYNLRGDIIPIVDLRTFFHLPIENKNADGQENMLILRIDDRVYGTIVDRIDKVVGVNSDTIQPPHPIFGDINIKYISGVVEKAGQLYIILDVVRIFTQSEEEKQKPRTAIQQETAGETYFVPPAAAETAAPVPQATAGPSDSAFGFVKESLAALRHFYGTVINDEWMRKRFSQWSSARSEADVQLKTADEADQYLESFHSPYNGVFWDDDYAAAVQGSLPNIQSKSIQVWNPGCGKGYETFSFACILKSRYPNAQIKIWANDNDIMAISTAPNMVFDLDEVPEFCRSYMVRGSNGYSFSQIIKDSIMFEYHDVLNDNPLPDLDIILVRDFLSFLPGENQEKMVSEFAEKMKNSGVVLVGRNEQLPGKIWRRISQDPVSAYMLNE